MDNASTRIRTAVILILFSFSVLPVLVTGCRNSTDVANNAGDITKLINVGDTGSGVVGYKGISFKVPDGYTAVLDYLVDEQVEIAVHNDSDTLRTQVAVLISIIKPGLGGRNDEGGFDEWKKLGNETVNGHELFIWNKDRKSLSSTFHVFPGTPYGDLVIAGQAGYKDEDPQKLQRDISQTVCY
ncbi:MAG: hypothetical protein JW738_05350 [Actinobacteria bacterium]|nr:hypothetical protein [Actinomycetota bacterium]